MDDNTQPEVRVSARDPAKEIIEPAVEMRLGGDDASVDCARGMMFRLVEIRLQGWCLGQRGSSGMMSRTGMISRTTRKLRSDGSDSEEAQGLALGIE
jgi:hypothetical protein